MKISQLQKNILPDFLRNFLKERSKDLKNKEIKILRQTLIIPLQLEDDRCAMLWIKYKGKSLTEIPFINYIDAKGQKAPGTIIEGIKEVFPNQTIANAYDGKPIVSAQYYASWVIACTKFLLTYQSMPIPEQVDPQKLEIEQREILNKNKPTITISKGNYLT